MWFRNHDRKTFPSIVSRWLENATICFLVRWQTRQVSSLWQQQETGVTLTKKKLKKKRVRAVVAADDNTCIVKRQDVQFRYDCKMKEQKFEDGDGISSAIWPNAVAPRGLFQKWNHACRRRISSEWRVTVNLQVNDYVKRTNTIWPPATVSNATSRLKTCNI